MIIPTVGDVVRSISQSIDTVITPTLRDLRERSAITTIRHMLRYVERAVEMEGQLLFEESGRLRALLADLALRIESRGGSDALAGMAAPMRALADAQRDPAVYPSVALLSGEILAFVQCVDDCLGAIHALPAQARDPIVKELHEKLRAYMVWQMEHEAQMIEPAFAGYGARR